MVASGMPDMGLLERAKRVLAIIFGRLHKLESMKCNVVYTHWVV
jgi:hypothetical protein